MAATPRRDPAPREGPYAALVHSLGGIVWEAEPATFRFTFVSPQAERILGYPARQWLDEPDFWRNHTHPDDVGWCSALCRDATAHGRDHTFEYRMIAADGRVVWLRDVVTVESGPAGPERLCGILIDVTDRKRLEEHLVQSQKMEAVGRLAGGVAHDFNNLLTVIRGYAELLRNSLAPGDARLPQAEEVLKAAGRAAELTGQLLAFGRKQVLQPRALDLNALIRDAERMLRRVIGADVELAATLRPGLAPVRADPGQLHQVVMNLAVNARDAMPTGGTLAVETAEADVADGAVPELAGGRYVVLAVRDTGVGMSEEVRARAFEPFFTTKGSGEGTGLGLATVYGIVKQSGGHVDVESAPGRGTTFRVYLPRAEPGEVAAAPAGEPGDPPGGSETILLAEDEPSVRMFVTAVLREAGYKVLEAAGGEEAARACEAHPGRIHLLMTDVVMPGMGGRELAGRVAALRPGTRVLYVSGYAGDALARYGVEGEAAGFLQKPFGRAALLGKVREVLDGG